MTTNTIYGRIDILTNIGQPGGFETTGTGRNGDGTDPEGDADDDGTTNGIDNCVFVYNPDQSDVDNDGIGDVCDQDFVSFTDISPVAPGPDRKDGTPHQPLYAFGAP